MDLPLPPFLPGWGLASSALSFLSRLSFFLSCRAVWENGLAFAAVLGQQQLVRERAGRGALPVKMPLLAVLLYSTRAGPAGLVALESPALAARHGCRDLLERWDGTDSGMALAASVLRRTSAWMAWTDFMAS